ncbi:MAG TPA: hypothetical protein VMG31_17235 [Verrucomicrobiae bacterium]|nr:hypothetical protein [Verrucomicrobiae bacterium]
MNFFQWLDVRVSAKVTILLAVLLIARSGVAEDVTKSAHGSELDRGFSGLYNLDFSGAEKDFEKWHADHPDDPMGPASEAAGYLFSEFNRLGVLEAQFYENDKAFAGRPTLTPDPNTRDHFRAAIEVTERLAHARLEKDSKDRDALLALTLSSGLQADYAALIEKRNLASLHFTKDASFWAQQLLGECQDCYDALLATGFSKYIIGSMSAPVRWILRLGGLPADKDGGIADLQTTAEHGHYLAPFARILLAIAYVRERNTKRAMELLLRLQHDFPNNVLFSREIARLQSR